MSVVIAVAHRTVKTVAEAVVPMNVWAGVLLVAWDTVLARFKTT
jgi:hypothetical protein